MQPLQLTARNIYDLISAINYIDEHSSLDACKMFSNMLNDNLSKAAIINIIDFTDMMEVYANKLFDDEKKNI